MSGAPSDPAEVQRRLWQDAGGETGWDVGANNGESAARMKGLFRRVISFEPAEESYRELALSYGEDRQVMPLQLALTDHEGTLTTSVRAVPIQSGQLVAAQMPYAGYVLGQRLDGTLPWGEELGTRDVPCSTADVMAALLGEPDFVKVDTEGHELQVLRGAAGLLQRGRVKWLIEFHDLPLYNDCLALLTDAGYEVDTIRHPHYAPNSEMWARHGWMRARKTEES